ncbi:MAG: peptidoglycan-binding protein [Alphaproteobacteria bacterium]|nr:peptidoglycan-binding protein [Alphaproteobacteria bacterium]MCZ6838984.1 peptidoglycan-binding protein [Alphaproteobacteria bacterium]
MRILFAVLLVAVLATQASAQDFRTGLDAYDRGDFAAALKEWRPLAEQGDARAQFNLGVILFNGQGLPHDPVEAVEWYRAAADQGYGPAQDKLAFMYETGQGLLQNYVQAYKWSTLAIRHGVDVRKTRDVLAAKMTPEQIAEADRVVVAWRPRLAENAPEPTSDADVQAASTTRSTEQVRKAQRQLNALGFNVGPTDGVAGPRTRAAVSDYQKHRKLPVTGVLDEDLFAQLAAGKTDDKPVEREEQIAKREPEESISSSKPVPEAEPPPVRAQDCDRLAAHPSDPFLPADVTGVAFEDIDADRAIEACELALALNAGDMRHQLQLARSLHKAERLDEAVAYYQQAGLQGHPLAQKSLGFAYANGLGVTRDYAKSAQWHLMAADQGDSDAQRNLGYLYAGGQGVDRDIVQAHMWYNIAAAHGSAGAAKNRDVLAGRMTDSQIAEAERRALAWFDQRRESTGSR